MRARLDWLITEQFIIGFFFGAGIALLCWVKSIWQSTRLKPSERSSEHDEDEAPVRDCHCRMCDAARAAKT